jgi:hypothetical protein
MKTVKNTLFLLLLIAIPAMAQQKTTTTQKATTAPPEQPQTNNDLKLKTRMEMQGFNMDSTVYFKLTILQKSIKLSRSAIRLRRPLPRVLQLRLRRRPTNQRVKVAL